MRILAQRKAGIIARENESQIKEIEISASLEQDGNLPMVLYIRFNGADPDSLGEYTVEQFQEKPNTEILKAACRAMNMRIESGLSDAAGQFLHPSKKFYVKEVY